MFTYNMYGQASFRFRFSSAHVQTHTKTSSLLPYEFTRLYSVHNWKTNSVRYSFSSYTFSLTNAKVTIQMRQRTQPQDRDAEPSVKPVGLSEPYMEFPPGLLAFSTVEPEPPPTLPVHPGL